MLTLHSKVTHSYRKNEARQKIQKAYHSVCCNSCHAAILVLAQLSTL